MKKTSLLILLISGFIYAQEQFPGENEGNIVFNAGFEDQPIWGKNDNDQFGWECRNCSRPNASKEIGPTGHKFTAPAAGGEYFGYTWAHDASIYQFMEVDPNTQYTVKYKFGWLHWTSAVHPIDSNNAPLVTNVILSETNQKIKSFELNNAGYATKIVNGTLEFDKWNDVEFNFTTPNEVYGVNFRLYKTNGTAPYMVDNVEIFPTPAASIDKFENVDFKFYPNPANNIINLKATKTISMVKFYNSLGQNVLTSKTNALQSKLNISKLNKGIYMMNVTIEGQTQAFKILKQ